MSLGALALAAALLARPAGAAGRASSGDDPFLAAFEAEIHASIVRDGALGSPAAKWVPPLLARRDLWGRAEASLERAYLSPSAPTLPEEVRRALWAMARSTADLAGQGLATQVFRVLPRELPSGLPDEELAKARPILRTSRLVARDWERWPERKPRGLAIGGSWDGGRPYPPMRVLLFQDSHEVAAYDGGSHLVIMDTDDCSVSWPGEPVEPKECFGVDDRPCFYRRVAAVGAVPKDRRWLVLRCEGETRRVRVE